MAMIQTFILVCVSIVQYQLFLMELYAKNAPQIVLTVLEESLINVHNVLMINIH